AEGRGLIVGIQFACFVAAGVVANGVQAALGRVVPGVVEVFDQGTVIAGGADIASAHHAIGEEAAEAMAVLDDDTAGGRDQTAHAGEGPAVAGQHAFGGGADSDVRCAADGVGQQAGGTSYIAVSSATEGVL